MLSHIWQIQTKSRLKYNFKNWMLLRPDMKHNEEVGQERGKGGWWKRLRQKRGSCLWNFPENIQSKIAWMFSHNCKSSERDFSFLFSLLSFLLKPTVKKWLFNPHYSPPEQQSFCCLIFYWIRAKCTIWIHKLGFSSYVTALLGYFLHYTQK